MTTGEGAVAIRVCFRSAIKNADIIIGTRDVSKGRRSQVGTRKNRGFEMSDIRKTGVLLLSMITKAACFPGFQGVNAYLEGEDGGADLGETDRRRTRHQDRFQGDDEASINDP